MQKELKMEMFWIKLFLALHDLNLNLQLDRNINLHTLGFCILSLETINKRKKNGNVVRALIWIRPTCLDIRASANLGKTKTSLRAGSLDDQTFWRN